MGRTLEKSVQKIRLNKFIADSGLASRRKADELIDSGQVMVNGKKVFELGAKVDPENDRITVSGKPVKPVNEMVYLVFHKPKNVLTSMSDPEGRPTVADFFIESPVRLFPVGRLDWETEGLLLMTNDGEFAQNIAHPTSEVTKTYLVKVDKKATDDQLRKLREGVSIIGGKVKALFVERMKSKGSVSKDWIRIVIDEGKNRQVRRMMEKVGLDVEKLQRVAIGQLELGTLKKGEFKPLTRAMLERIFKPDFQVAKKKKLLEPREEKAPTTRKTGNAPTKRAIAGKKAPQKSQKALFGD